MECGNVVSGNYLDLGGTVLRNCGESSGEDGDVVTMKYIINYLNRWFPTQVLDLFRDNARACYYFKTKDAFIQHKGKIIGFKSQSKYHHVNAKSQTTSSSLTTVELPSKEAFCASFAGATRLSVANVHLSPRNLYTTLVVTFKCSNSEVTSTGENIVTDCDRALTVLGRDMQIFGTSSSSISITPLKKLNEWNTVYIQWGTDADRSGHVYVNGQHVQEFTSSVGRPHVNDLRIGGLSDENPSFWSG